LFIRLIPSKVLALLVVLGLTACINNEPIQEGPLQKDLVEGRVEHLLQKGEIHSFPFEVKKGQFMRVDIRPKYWNLKLELADESGLLIRSYRTRLQRSERLLFLPEEDTRYVLRIMPFGTDIYDIGTTTHETADPWQKKQFQMQAAFWEAIDWVAKCKQRFKHVDEKRAVFQETVARLEALLDEVGTLEDEAFLVRLAEELYSLYLDPVLRDRDAFLHHVNKALALSRSLGDPSLETRALYFILFAKGAPNDLEALQDQVFRILEVPSDCSTQSSQKSLTAALQSLCSLYSSRHEHQLSLECYSVAHEMARGTSDPRQEAIVLQNIGLAYNGLGDNKRFHEYLEKADIAWNEWERKYKKQVRHPSYFSSLGKYYQVQGQYPEALEQYRKSLELSLNAPPWVIFSINDKIGATETRLQNYEEGIKYFEMNLASSKGVYRAKTLYELGNAYYQKAISEGAGREGGRLDMIQASNYLAQALDGSRREGDATIEANVLLLQAHIQVNHGGGDAGPKLQSAIALIEKKRQTVKDASLRSDFFADNQKFYNAYLNYLLKQEGGNPTQALHVAEGARARNLLDVLSGQSDPDRGSFDWDLLKKYWWTQHQIVDIPIGEQESRRAALHAAKQALALALERRREPGLTSEKILSGDEIRQLAASDGTVFLEYHLEEGAGRVWMITGADITTVALPGRKELDPLIRRARTELSRHPNGKAPPGNPLTELGRTLLGPFPGLLKHKRVVIVADGLLQLLPFGALPMPGNPDTVLLDRIEVGYLPSVSVLAAIREEGKTRQPAPKDLAVIYDPIYRTVADPIVASGERSGTRQFSRLINTVQEADDILALFPDGTHLRASREKANKDLCARLGDYRLIHFATHGFIDTDHPDRSSLVLSLYDSGGQPQDGHLTLAEISTLNLNADLVVLSACKTAVGKEVRGEGLVSLARGFMHAGAPRVVATLWQVSDNHSPKLMKEFYHQMLVEKLPPAQALRQAQLIMKRNPRWSSPYYWAPYVFIGDWL